MSGMPCNKGCQRPAEDVFFLLLLQAILLPVYYAVYCTLGPQWVSYLDGKIDFAAIGTTNPLSTLLGVWTCVSAAAIPVLIAATKVSKRVQA